MSTIRAARMAEELRAQISDIVQHHLSDPRLAWISVVRVEVSPDLHYAKVFVSALGSEETQEQSLRVLSRARGAVRAELGHRLRLRKLPEIVFRTDHSIDTSLRIQGILKELGFTGEESGGSGADAREEGEE
jgi:ribosome-binding factor A